MDIVFGSLVDSDLAKARDWYDEQRPGLGETNFSMMLTERSRKSRQRRERVP